MRRKDRHNYNRCGYGGCPITVPVAGMRCEHHQEAAAGHEAAVERLKDRIRRAREARQEGRAA